MMLLQIDSTAVPVVGPESKDSLFSLILAGGWTMIPIGILLVLAVYIFVERYLNIRKANQDPQAFMATVRSHVLSGNLDQARNYCMQENTPFSRMILKGINRLGNPLQDISAAIENVGSLEVYRLEKRLGLLATFAGAAPMLGFFGTVIGMIEAFGRISDLKGNVSPEVLAEPISTAMVTTAAGLVVGVVAYLGYNTLVNMVSSVVHKMESTSTDFIDLLQEPAK